MSTMATSMKLRRLVMLLIVLTLLVISSSEARFVPQFSTRGKKVNSKIGLREVINSVRQQKRSMLGGKPERVSPGGPDSQHH